MRQRRSGRNGDNQTIATEIFLACISLLSFYFVYHIWAKDNHDVNAIKKALRKPVNVSTTTAFELPPRIKRIMDSNDLVGGRLVEVKANNIVLADIFSELDTAETQKPPLSMEEITSYLNRFISQLSTIIKSKNKWTADEAWEAYRNLTVHTLYKWDQQEYLKRMPERRLDDSLFFSLVSYRDENCLSTISNAFEKAERPEKLFVGLVQQNCVKDCYGRGSSKVKPDEDCYEAFCSSPKGKPLCEAGHVRSLFIHESESLGPYTARLFASKLWYGETWFMQTDSHMTFLQGWDTISVDMIKNAPTEKAAISHYPPPHTADLESKRDIPGARLCGPTFSTDHGEAQIIRLVGEAYFDKKKLPQPRFAPFVGAGFFLVHSGFLSEVPFDPFLPWIFMGEEIILSARLWTHGYDIYSPTQPVLGHIYGRLDKPKFWDTINRVFKSQIFSNLNSLIVTRVKYQLEYPESARDFTRTKSLFTALDDYTLGTNRTLNEYLEYCSLNLVSKQVLNSDWCETGGIPKGFEEYAHFYK